MFSPTSFWQQIYLAIVKKCFTCAFAATNTAARYDSPDLNSKTRYAIVKKYFTYTFTKAKVPKFTKQRFENFIPSLAKPKIQIVKIKFKIL